MKALSMTAWMKCTVILLGLGVVTWALSIHLVAFGLGGVLIAAALSMAAVVMDSPTLGTRTAESHEEVQEQETRPRSDRRGKRTLIVGAGSVGGMLAESLEAAGGYQVVGFIDDDFGLCVKDRWPILGTRADTELIVKQYDVEDVIIAYAPTWQQCLAESLTANLPEVKVRVVPTSYDAMLCTKSVQNYGDVAVVPLIPAAKRATDRAQRLFDIVLAFCGLVLLFPISLLTALMIKLTSPGPVLFRQERVGRFGKLFWIYKFRSMRHDAEGRTGPVLSSGKSDARLTPVGRWIRLCRLDEIPQLWNVLQGEMSMVGPRPERPCFVNRYEALTPTYTRRHDVRPGITGLAQICGGYHTDSRDKLRFDLIYVSHQSLWLDLRILLRTVLVVILPEQKKFESKNAIRE